VARGPDNSMAGGRLLYAPIQQSFHVGCSFVGPATVGDGVTGYCLGAGGAPQAACERASERHLQFCLARAGARACAVHLGRVGLAGWLVGICILLSCVWLCVCVARRASSECQVLRPFVRSFCRRVRILCIRTERGQWLI